MADEGRTAVAVSGKAAGAFSTFQREIESGRLFSSRFSPESAMVFDPTSRKLVTVTSEIPSIALGDVFPFVLEGLTFPRNLLCVPGGPCCEARGSAELRAGGDVAQLTARVNGLGPLPPGTNLTVWLIHDLVVPDTLHPADLACLPRLAPGVNLPGTRFTVDGLPPNLGRTDVPAWNTVAVPVRAGELTVQPDGTALLQVPLSPDRNLALDPRALVAGIGGAAAPALPSGIVAAILTDCFMRPATVFPQLDVRTCLPQRIAAITQAVVSRFDKNCDGCVTPEEVAGVPGAFLCPGDFNRLAITAEPVAKTAPALLPTEAGLVLVGHPHHEGHGA
ncbi:MAG: hypothetical protein L6E13_06170 [Firmicutes bacterium]|nr:hypothetical protein [Bacillota bacterium]